MADRVAGPAGRHVLLALATSTGGVGRHVHALQRGLLDLGWRAQVACPASTQDIYGFPDHLPWEVGSRPRPRDAIALATLRRSPADVVHAHGVRAGGLAVLSGHPTAVTWHNAQTGGRLGRLLERLVARRAGTTLAVSPDLETRARALGARDVRAALVAAPALPARTGSDIPAELGAVGRPIVLAVGRLYEQKGLDVLLAAVPLLGDVVVAIAGDGPRRAELVHQAEGLDVRFLGRREDLADLYAAAAVVVLPSRWEGRPLTAMEVLRAGRPLVATPVGGVPQLVRDGAILVPPEAPEALAAAVLGLLADPAAAAALAERGVRVAASWPDERAVVAQAAAVYVGLRR